MLDKDRDESGADSQLEDFQNQKNEKTAKENFIDNTTTTPMSNKLPNNISSQPSTNETYQNREQLPNNSLPNLDTHQNPHSDLPINTSENIFNTQTPNPETPTNSLTTEHPNIPLAPERKPLVMRTDTQTIIQEPGVLPENNTFISPYAYNLRSSTKTQKSQKTNIFIAATLSTVLGASIGFGLSWALIPGETNVNLSPRTSIVNNTDKLNATTAAADKVVQSSVSIKVASGNGNGFNSSAEAGAGSGVIISPEGYILTNSHVVTLAGKASKNNVDISVRLHDGSVYSAKVIGIAPYADLAVIKIETKNLLPALEFYNSDKLNVGQNVIAVGYPLSLQESVTQGIISSLRRTIRINRSDFIDRESFQNGTTAPSLIALPVIQTDAAINSGNSGGALADMDGKLVGINVAISSSQGSTGNIGLGFAIPANYAERVSREIIATGSSRHGYLGVGAGDLNSSEDKGPTFSAGALIDSVVEGSPAQRGGLQVDDVIIGINNSLVESMLDLNALILSEAPEESVRVTYLRNGVEQTAQIVLGSSDNRI